MSGIRRPMLGGLGRCFVKARLETIHWLIIVPNVV